MVGANTEALSAAPPWESAKAKRGLGARAARSSGHKFDTTEQYVELSGPSYVSVLRSRAMMLQLWRRRASCRALNGGFSFVHLPAHRGKHVNSSRHDQWSRQCG